CGKLTACWPIEPTLAPARRKAGPQRAILRRSTRRGTTLSRPFLPDIPMRLALAQFDFPVGAVAANTARVLQLIERARDELAADLVVFPELAICGYPPEDLLLRPSFLEACEVAVDGLIPQVQG